MIRRLLHWLTHAGLERPYGYDATYMHGIIDVSTGAGLRLMTLPLISQYRGPETAVWAGACLASTLDGDCGSCAQLVVDAGVKAGVDPALLRACLTGDFTAADAAGLGFRFAQAAITDDPAVDGLRADISSTYGERAVIAASYAAASGRVYPVLKRALGHGRGCQTLKVGEGPDIVVAGATA